MTLPAQTYTDTLQLLDGSTVVFDLNLRTGAGNPNTLKTVLADLDIGTPVPDREFFDDRLLVREDYGPVDMSLSLHAEAVDYELLQAGLGTLARLLKDPKHRIKWLRQGASAGEERFIHFHSADVEPPQGFHALRESRVLNLPISIIREPFLRGPEATLVNAVAVPNDPADTNGKAIAVDNAGDAPAPATLKVTGDTGSKIQEVLVGVKLFPTTAIRTDYTETKFAQCEATGGGWTVALGTNTSSVVDTDASGGNAASTDHLLAAGMAKRITLTRTTKLSSLQGAWDVYVRWGKQGQTGPPVYTLQLRWGLSTTLPATNVESPVRLEQIGTPGGTRSDYLFLKLGRINVPENAAGLSLELWSQCNLNNRLARWDHLFFVPADRVSLLSMMAEEGTWNGADLVTPVSNPSGGTAGVVSGNSLILDNTTDDAGTTPSGGFNLAAGRHRVGFYFAPSAAAVTVRVRNITDSTTVTEKVAVGWPFGVVYLEFDIVSGGANDPADFYQFQVDDPTAVPITVLRVTHSFVPVVLSGESFLSDGEDADKIDASGKVLAPATVAGSVPLALPPGACVLAFSYGDIRRDSFALGAENVLTRDPTVTVTYQPHYLT